ncbi:MAG: DNA gyrase subunit A [Actinomycetota bacterium]
MPNEEQQSRIAQIDIEREMQDSFLEYAMSVIVSRALPDVRDGLKPVHRRILYAMHDAGIRAGTPFRKCARVVGDVVGWFHPHSPEAVYDAMVRLGQDFSMRSPLIQPQGNFGTVDDPAAAMRYCVTGDTRIRTTEGTVLIRDIVPNAAEESDHAVSLKVLGRRGDPQVADRFFHSGNHSTLRLATREGFELTGTRNHPVLTLTSVEGIPVLLWKLLEEIEPGDRVAMARPDNAGDGGDDLSREEAIALAEETIQSDASGAVPEAVWRAHPEAKKEYVEALVGGGLLSSKRGTSGVEILLSTRSERLAADFQHLLLECGIVANLSHFSNGETNVCLANRRDAEIPFLADYLRSEAGRGGLEWLKKHNIDRVERWERDGEEILDHIADPEVRRIATHIVDHGFYYATVSTVEGAGVQPVYSLRVESEDHAFLGNGFVNHNTEARMSPIAAHLLESIDEDTVNWSDNYSGEREEPDVLPARFPNLLVNGSTGIAVGMATNIPPHNLTEVVDAVLYGLDHPEATVADLSEFVKGPDFPSGAYIVGMSGVKQALATGRGSVKMRAVTDIVEMQRGRVAIIATEIPYQVSRDRIMEKTAELVRKKIITGIADLRDESDRDGTRLVIELRKDANPQVILNQLFKMTQLEENFAVNQVALVDGVPRTLNVAEMVHYYIGHQLEVIERRSKFRLAKAKARAHIVEGLLIALDNIDEVVEIIKSSEDVSAAREALMERFELSEVQANHILDMPLRRLTALETGKLREEYGDLQATIADLEALLASEDKRRAIIGEELTVIRDKFGDKRRSRIIPDMGEMSLEDLIADEELVVTVSAAGYVKSVLAKTYKTQGRGGRGVRGAALREDDVIEHVIHTSAHAYLLVFTNQGKVYRVRAHEIPRKDRNAKGVLVQSVLPMDPDEIIEAVIDTRDYETHQYLVMFTKQGQVKKTKFSDYDSRNQVLVAIKLQEGDEVVDVRATNGDSDLLMFTKKGQGIRFTEQDVRPMGRASQGVRGIRLRDGDEVVAGTTAEEGDEVLLLTNGGYGKRTKMDLFRRQGRGGMGVKAMKLTRVRGVLVAARAVTPDDEVFMISSDGIVIRQAVSEISRQRRESTGVKVVSLDSDAELSAVALVPTNGD